MRENNYRRAVLLLSIGLFITSLTLNSYYLDGDKEIFTPGYVCFIFGILGIFIGGAGLTWLANPLLFISWFFVKKKPIIGIVLSFLSLLISLSFLFFDEVLVSESGVYSEITGYGIGYWFWITSSFILCVGNVLLIMKRKLKIPM